MAKEILMPDKISFICFFFFWHKQIYLIKKNINSIESIFMLWERKYYNILDTEWQRYLKEKF